MSRPSSAAGRFSQAPADFRWVDTEPSVCAIGVRQNLTVIVWWTQATAAAVERVARLTRDVCAEYGRMSNVHLIRDGALVPTPAARTGFVQMMRDHADQLSNVAVVVGGSGFWASMMRSAITGMRFVAPRTFELRLHGRAEEIVNWLPRAHAARCGTPLPHDELANMLSLAERNLVSGSVEVQPAAPATLLFSQRVSLRPRKPGV
jgi:hypothetical protein